MSRNRAIDRSLHRPIAKALTGDSSGGGSALPSGAIGVWYADQYQATPRRVIPNAINLTSVSANLFTAPRRLFSNTTYYAATSATVTDDAAAGPDGTSGEASTLVASGSNWLLRQAMGASVPAGTYTLACWVKRNTGTDQTFKFSSDNTATKSSVKTATSAWQRFTYTFTLGSTTTAVQFSICSDDATNANIQICDFELFAGSSDLGIANGTNPAGHMYLGSNHYASQPAVASNELDLTNEGIGMVQLAGNNDLSAGFTYITILKKTVAGSAYHTTLSKSQAYTHLTFSTEVSKATTNWIGTTTNYYGSAVGAGPWELLNQGYHAHSMRYDGSNRDWFLDDCLLHRVSGAVTSQTYRDFDLGFVSAPSLFAGEKVYCMALWNRALSDSEVRQAVVYLQGKANAASLSASNYGRIICFEGDSISGQASTCFPYYYGTNLANPAFLGHIFAVSGSSITELNARAATVDAALPPVANRSGRKFILSVLIGANGLASGAAAYLSDLRTYLIARRAAGWTINLCTPTPATIANFNTQRALALPTMRAWTTSDGVDMITDFAANATYGVDAAASDGAKYGDGLHPTVATQQLMATDLASVLNAA